MICVDSSVAVKWIVEEPDSPMAIRLYSVAFARGHHFIAPYLLPFEISNVLRRRSVRSGLPLEEAHRLFEDFLGIGVELVYDTIFHQQALTLAAEFNLPASYDAHYLALARREVCDFWTADKRLLNALRGRMPFVRDLATLTDDAIPPAT